MTQTLETKELLGRIHEAQGRISQPKEEACIVVGGTREGKSTLVKLFAGHNLVVFRKDTGEIAIKAPDNDANQLPLIGHDNLQSETKIPYQVVLSEKASIWDPPGKFPILNL